MPKNDELKELRADLDYDALIEKASPALRLYITTLEQENARLRQELIELRQSVAGRQRAAASRERPTAESSSPVVTVRHPEDAMVVTMTGQGLAKRTPLNDYSTQRRGGVGVFDIQAPREDLVAHVLVARESAAILVLSSRGRAFRVPVDSLPLTELRGRGTALPARLMLTDGETIAAVLVLDDERDDRSNVLIATANGWVRSLHRNYVGPRLQPGTLLSDPRRGGPPSAMTLSSGEGDLLIATRSGLGYRFSQHLLRREGVSGIQVRPNDALAGIVSIGGDDDDVLLVSGDGRGTRRDMSGFSTNKSPGGQGKILMKTDVLAGLARVTETCDVLCVSGFAKIIRFAVDEVPVKSGSVQGVNVMDCRGDTLSAMDIVSPPRFLTIPAPAQPLSHSAVQL